MLVKSKGIRGLRLLNLEDLDTPVLDTPVGLAAGACWRGWKTLWRGQVPRWIEMTVSPKQSISRAWFTPRVYQTKAMPGNQCKAKPETSAKRIRALKISKLLLVMGPKRPCFCSNTFQQIEALNSSWFILMRFSHGFVILSVWHRVTQSSDSQAIWKGSAPNNAPVG